MPYGDHNLLRLPDDVPDEKGLYLSDVLATSWHCVVDTGVKKGDTVAVWGAGPIGQMVAEFSFFHGASRVILIDGGDGGWRLDFVKSKIPKVETVDYTQLPRGETVRSQLKKMVYGGPDVALECAAGEYPKGWIHYFELLFGMEMDTSEILNEMITSTRPFGRVGITGVYAGYVSLHPSWEKKNADGDTRQITSTLGQLCKQVAALLATAKPRYISIGRSSWSSYSKIKSTRCLCSLTEYDWRTWRRCMACSISGKMVYRRSLSKRSSPPLRRRERQH